MNQEKWESVKAYYRDAKRRGLAEKTAAGSSKSATEKPKEATPEQIAAAVEVARREEREKVLSFARAVAGPGPDMDRLDKAVKMGVTAEQMRAAMQFMGKIPGSGKTPTKRPAGVETGRSGVELLRKIREANGMMGESIQKGNFISSRDTERFKTYEDAAQFFIDTRGMTKAAALQEAARKFPGLHREYIERANRGEPLQSIF